MIFDRLKTSTALQHRRLEQIVGILEPGLNVTSYGVLLVSFYAFYAVIEPKIFEHDEWKSLEFDPQPRRKLALLSSDLAALGLPLPLPCPELAQLKNFSQVLGAMYVLEGATLGGQVIGRHLQHHLGLRVENGAAFFGSYGERVGPMWLEFRAFLSAQALDDQIENEIVSGALEMFERLGDWLERERISS